MKNILRIYYRELYLYKNIRILADCIGKCDGNAVKWEFNITWEIREYTAEKLLYMKNILEFTIIWELLMNLLLESYY